MNNKVKVIILVIIITLQSCSYPNYLPEYDEIDINQFGSYIELYLIDNLKNEDFLKYNSLELEGELIAVYDNYILLSLESNHKVIKVPLDIVDYLELHYAKPVDYTWAYTELLFSVTHGVFLVVTLPINAITVVAVNISSKDSYSYNTEKQIISSEMLKQFARFPQGIPDNVDIKDIR